MTEQYDPRYRLKGKPVVDAVMARRSNFLREQARERLKTQAFRPSNIGWFERLLEEPATKEGQRVGLYCSLVPPEIPAALGLRPVPLGCGDAAQAAAGDEFFGGEVCPLAKAAVAALAKGAVNPKSFVALVCPASCDAKRKLGEILSDFAPAFTLNLPSEQDARAAGPFMQAELERLTAFFEGIAGRRMGRAELAEQITLTNERARVVRALQALRLERPGALSVRDFFIITQAAMSGGREWLAQATHAGDEARARQFKVSLKPRVVLTGAPLWWPGFKLLDVLEEAGAEVVADTLCSGSQVWQDPVVYEERSRGAMLRALAHRHIFSSLCPCFVSQGRLLTRLLELARQTSAVGVVHHGLRLCQLFDLESYRLSRVLRREKLPLLALRTDLSLEDVEQLRVRVEAFLETVGSQETLGT